MKTLLIDSDMLLYRMACACQETSPFNPELVIKACPVETWSNIELRVKQCVELAQAEFPDEEIKVVHCLSPKEKTFRYDLFPEYKANRKDTVRPVLLGEMRDKLCKETIVQMWDSLEADDVIGILADGEDTIVVSSDKDLKQIESYHMSLSYPEFIDYFDEESGVKFFLTQCIAGDPTDGYYGVPGIGMAKAKKLLEKEGYTWETVVSAYTGAMSPKTHKGKKIESYNLGLTEDDALLTARMAYILKEEDEYNKDTKEVTYWHPANWTGWIQG